MLRKHHIKASLALLTVALAALAATPVSAQESTVESGTVYERGGLVGTGIVIGAKAAVGFGQVYDTSGTGWLGELELGWVTPYRPIQIFATGSYVSTGREGTGEPDARLPGEMSYDFTQQQFVLTLGALYRLPLSTDLIRPYAALGGRIYLTSTEIDGEAASEPFGTYTEEGTNYGIYGALGADIFVGPGSILFEIQTGWAPVDRFVLQDTSTGALNIALGYRIFL